MKDEDRWIPFEQIEAECNALRKRGGKPPMQKPTGPFDTKIDDFLVTAMKTHVNKFFPRDDAEELLFGVGIPEAEMRAIQAYARSKKLVCDTRQHNEESYLVIYIRQDLQKVVKALKAKNGVGQYGKYMLVPRNELPSLNDIGSKKVKAMTTLVKSELAL